ncbi:MAG TPA: hypothetical protein VK190_11800 [Pseudoneobacillus sp.]|nr:hypothetical protein [Pseudoneobacillus sp.]
MKKILSALLMATLIFSPVGNVVFQDHSTTVEAKSYKSGKRSFNTNRSNTNSFFQKKQDTTRTYKSTSPTRKSLFKPGGFMKGLMFGGLAGLLFGSLFANMGFMGSILGFIINIFAIIVLISVIRRIFAFFMNKNKSEDSNPWRR